MNKQQLNTLATAAKNDAAAVWEIKAHYMPLIEKLQLENWHKMNSEIHFEDDCFRKLDYGIRTFDASKGDFDKRAKALIYQSLKEYCGRRGNRRAVLTSLDKEITTEDTAGFESYGTYDKILKDSSVDVEEAAIEEVAKQELLAKYAGNEMDELIIGIILSANELLTQSEITRRLADKTGRTFNSARGVVRSFCNKKQQGARAC